MTKRAERRHHRKRLKNKVKRLQKQQWGKKPSDAEAGKLADNLAWCQHVFCQCPRKLLGPPFKDIKRSKAADDRED